MQDTHYAFAFDVKTHVPRKLQQGGYTWVLLFFQLELVFVHSFDGIEKDQVNRSGVISRYSVILPRYL